MLSQHFQIADWYRATTLRERLKSLRDTHWHHNDTPKSHRLSLQQLDQRVQRWRDSLAFEDDVAFAQRLEFDGLSEDEFFYLLGEPIEHVRDRTITPPSWLTRLEQAFSEAPTLPAIALPDDLNERTSAGLLHAIKPLTFQTLTELHQHIQALKIQYDFLPFDPENVDRILSKALPRQLLRLLTPVMALELNVARLQGHLKGETPAARFDSFLERLHQPDNILAIFQEYPVLARQLMLTLDHWVNYSIEFLQHLCKDWVAITNTFSPEQNPGLLASLDTNLGDPHKEGRAVMVAKFSNGLHLVYKPKPLTVDLHFQELLAWINTRGTHPPFRVLNVIDRQTYGWVEYVEPQDCTSEAEIQRFYERQGGYLALLYILEATDFHFENIIASGEHPVCLDLEALFHPRITQFHNISAGSDARAQIERLFYHSVLSTGLLPNRILVTDDDPGMDFSGLGAATERFVPRKTLQWKDIGTDEMRLAPKLSQPSVSSHQPNLNGESVNVLDYAGAIRTGFDQVYRLLQQYQDDLLEADGPLSRFKDDEIRVILRPTLTYGVLLKKSLHPDVLRDALECDRWFDMLWVDIAHNAHLLSVLKSERDSLHKGDVPVFRTRPNSRDLWTGTGEHIPNFLAEPSFTTAQQRVQQLSDADREQQLWFIKATLATLEIQSDHTRYPHYPLTQPQTLASQARLLTAARAVGDRLEVLAVQGEHEVAWAGLNSTEHGGWALVPSGVTLYSGLSGIALFLAYLGAITGENRYQNLAQKALTTLQKQIEPKQDFGLSIGVFEGWGGIIYALTHLGVLWGQPELFLEAEAIAQFLPSLIEQDIQFDIIGGSAGCLASLLGIYRHHPSPQILATAYACGEHLLAHQQSSDQGAGWIAEAFSTKPMTGFSHGAAGIAWPLLELAALTHEKRFHTAALQALEYERQTFVPEVGNWPDLRHFTIALQKDANHQPLCSHAWCHGAPGIGLARLNSLPYLSDETIHAEIKTALTTTLKTGFGNSHSLCHGDLGNLDLLLNASQKLKDPQWKFHVDHLTAIILESIDQYGWLCGVPLGVEVPGLMLGLAGIGYQLLRLAEPGRVPSVLALEYPNI